MLDSCLMDKLSVEIYENQIFSSNFTPIHEYVFGLYFLTTLNIYKDYFKGRRKGCNLMQKFFQAYYDQRLSCPN